MPKSSQIISSNISSSVKDKDLELWRTWSKTKSPQDLEALFRQMENVIQRQVSTQTGSLPAMFLELKAKEYAKKAFESYDPNKGVALSTHLVNQLRQLSRLNFNFHSVVRAPEYQQRKAGEFLSAKDALKDSLGRSPTTTEVADHLKWNVKEVARLELATRSELSDAMPLDHATQSSFSAGLGAEDMDPIVIYFYNELSPQDKILFEHTTGYGGKQVLSNSALAAKLNIPYAQLSYRKRLLVQKLNERITTRGRRV